MPTAKPASAARLRAPARRALASADRPEAESDDVWNPPCPPRDWLLLSAAAGLSPEDYGRLRDRVSRSGASGGLAASPG